MAGAPFPSYGDLGGKKIVKLPFHETGTTLLFAVTEKEHCLFSQQYVSLLHSCISKSLWSAVWSASAGFYFLICLSSDATGMASQRAAFAGGCALQWFPYLAVKLCRCHLNVLHAGVHAGVIFSCKCISAIHFFLNITSQRSPLLLVYLHWSPRRRLLFSSSALISVSSHLVSSSFLLLLLSVHALAARLTLFPPGFGNHTGAATWLLKKRTRQQPPVLSLPSGKSLERGKVKWREKEIGMMSLCLHMRVHNCIDCIVSVLTPQMNAMQSLTQT